MRTTTGLEVAKQFVDHWIIPYGAPDYLLSDNCPQLVAKVFEAICASLQVKRLTTTAYHTEMNDQVERLNRTLFTRIGCYVANTRKIGTRMRPSSLTPTILR